MAQLAVEMTGDEAKLWRSFQKIIKEQQKMEGGFKRIGKAGKQAGRQAKQAFGPQAASDITKYLGSLLGVSAAMAGIIAGLRKVNAEAKEVAQKIEETAGLDKKIRQISDTPAEYQVNKMMPRFGGAAYGVPVEQAKQLLFDIKSSGGSLQDVRQGYKLYGVEEDVLTASQRIMQTMKSFPKAGGFATLANVMGEAARESAASFSQIAAISLNPAKIAKSLARGQVGGQRIVDEMLTVVGGATLGAPSMGQAETQVTQLFQALSKDEADRFRGLSPFQALEKLAGLSVEEQDALLRGRKEARLGFETIMPQLSQMPGRYNVLQEARGRVGTPESWINKKFGEMLQEPEQAVIFHKRRMQARKDMALWDEGLREQAQENAYEATMNLIRKKPGANTLARMIGGAVGGVMDLFNISAENQISVLTKVLYATPEGQKKVAAGLREELGATVGPDFITKIEDGMNAIRELLDETREVKELTKQRVQQNDENRVNAEPAE